MQGADDLRHALTMRRRFAARLRGMVRICAFLCRSRADQGSRWRLPVWRRSGMGRPAGLPCTVNCLASESDFAITWRNEMVARAECVSNPPASKKSREDFDAQCARAGDRSGISGRAGGDAGRIGGAGRNPGTAADARLAGWPQGGGGANSRRPERRGAGPRRQDVCLQQWRLRVDSDPQHDHAGAAARRLSRRLDPARRSAKRQGRDRGRQMRRAFPAGTERSRVRQAWRALVLRPRQAPRPRYGCRRVLLHQARHEGDRRRPLRHAARQRRRTVAGRENRSTSRRRRRRGCGLTRFRRPAPSSRAT